MNRLRFCALIGLLGLGVGWRVPSAIAADSNLQKDRFVTVTGEVPQPGRIPFPYQREMTIADAITAAGGFKRMGDIRKVKLTRRSADGKTTESIIDVDAIMKAGGGNAPKLEDGDVVHVPKRMT